MRTIMMSGFLIRAGVLGSVASAASLIMRSAASLVRLSLSSQPYRHRSEDTHTSPGLISVFCLLTLVTPLR
jgi:hypothetical protein